MFHLSRVLDRAARLFADRVAVTNGEHALSYSQLGERVARLAAGLRAMGLAAGERVAILDRNSLRYLEVNYACARLGLILIPLNARLASPEILAILRQTDCRVVFVSDPFIPVARDCAAALSGLALLTWPESDPPGAANDYERLLRESAPVANAAPSDPGETAQIFFTSGTTGEPKGVCLTSGNLVASAYDSIALLGIEREDVWLHSAPMFHLVDAFAIWAVSLVGARHVVAPFDAESFPELVARERITQTSLPPTLIDMIATRHALSRVDLSSLRRISHGEAPMPEAVHGRASAFFPCPMLQAYGITEASGIVCHQLPGDYRMDGTEQERARRPSVGRPAPSVDLKVVDDAGAELPAGEIGELAVAGPRVMTGYWRNPQATAAAMREGWYFTGDLGYRDEQWQFFIADRKKDMIITGGENVYSAEVESVLTTHPAVLEAAVFGIPSERWGEEVKAVVVPKEGMRAAAGELIEHCRGRIGAYKIPKTIEFSREPLPKTGPGKIAKNLLREPYWKGQARKI